MKLFIIILSLLISSCSVWQSDNKQLGTTSSFLERAPASSIDKITYYLSIDKFKYYLNEYSVAQVGKLPENIVNHLRNLTVEEILKMNLDADDLKDANKYDDLILKILEDKNLKGSVSKNDLKWNYNFFKNKLNEAFVLAPSKLDLELNLEHGPPEKQEADVIIKPREVKPEDMTLDSGHYISNRTTRAIFWEMNQNQRTVEFHLGDSREFLKELKENNGEILLEVKPFAKNYNKIYIVQYPGEKDYRYAITNIGGQDRLDHLTHQISLSNLGEGGVKARVIIKGDIKSFHAKKVEEHEMQLRLLPAADRVIIGQKESIDGKFNLFWKIAALKTLYADEQASFQEKLAAIPEKDRVKFFSMVNSNDYEAFFKDKKIIEDAFLLFENEVSKNPTRFPGKFKIYNYDNFTVEMCDYVFESEGKEVRWRVISNVWGDEVVPIAQALKNTGNTKVTYMGTAGAFAGKDYKVGDLVIPGAIRDAAGTLKMSSPEMKIEGGRYGGMVEHVGSPFDEDNAWLAKTRVKSDFVEVETSYLRRIFNGANDKLEFYLIISDILGSDTETLAHATSSKRKNSQNKLLAELFKRDAKTAPVPASKVKIDNQAERVKNLVFNVLEKKTAAFKYYAFSNLKNNKNLTVKDIIAFAEQKAAFSDSYILERLVKISEVIDDLQRTHPKSGDFNIAFSKSLILGTWNPKEEKLQIVIKAKDNEVLKSIQKSLLANKKFIDSLSSFAALEAKLVMDDPNMVWMKAPKDIDADLFTKLYTLTGFKNAGLYKNVTYNGNVTLGFLPTNKFENPLEAFYQGKGKAYEKATGDCNEAIKMFMEMM